MWRNYYDVQDSWSSVLDIVDFWGSNSKIFTKYAGPGGWNDPDMVSIFNFRLYVSLMRRKLFFIFLIKTLFIIILIADMPLIIYILITNVSLNNA